MVDYKEKYFHDLFLTVHFCCSIQVQLEKHVNGHFNNSDQPSSSKRSSDPPAPKKVKKDQKKTKVRRQPWSGKSMKNDFAGNAIERVKKRGLFQRII